ncbi:MAG: hypothetical protein LBR34_10005 [Prevotella sp.]|jgi:hypothetical protein|nr:hypothetical protein [Prevotella sp.]
MKLFPWRTPDKKQEENIHVLPEIRREDFVDDTEPVATQTRDENIITIDEYGTGQPIDIIYSALREDYESKGFNDALLNPDISYKNNNLQIIRGNLEVKFKQVLLKYHDNLKRIDSAIKTLISAGSIDSVDKLTVEKEIWEKHVDEINEMKKDLDKKEVYMMGIFNSYEKGFLKGLTDSSAQILKMNGI